MDGTGTEWLYVASKNADRWHSNKNLVFAEIKKLEELNEIAQIPNLSWKLVYANPKDFSRIERDDKFLLPCLKLLNQAIPKGCIGTTKKAEKGIINKYKIVFSKIQKDFAHQ